MSSRLATSLCGIPLKNPVLAASGTYAYGIEFADLVDLSAIGGIVVKGLSKDPIEGDRKSTRLNSSHSQQSRMPSSA